MSSKTIFVKVPAGSDAYVYFDRIASFILEENDIAQISSSQKAVIIDSDDAKRVLSELKEEGFEASVNVL